MRRFQPRVRYFIELVVLITIGLATDKALAFYTPADLRVDMLFNIASRIPVFACSWLLLRLHGDTAGTVGLRRPASWSRAILVGIAVTMIMFLGIWISEQIGVHRDLSYFKPLQHNLELTIYEVFFVLIGAGFWEEFIFRGFIFQRLAMSLGGSGPAWIAACIAQAALFGLAHSYQNALGMVITGSIGLIMGVLFLACGRNLWPCIICHGFYDASRIIWFYFYGAPA